MTIKEIEIDGIAYSVAEGHYKKIISYLKKNAHQTARIKNTTKVHNLRDILTYNMATRLIGHADVIYYNFDMKVWNTKIYNGYHLNSQELNTKYAIRFKEQWIDQKNDVVAPVVMTIDSKVCPGWGKLVEKPKYSQKGTAVVGNIIIRNKKTSKLELYGKSWICVNVYFRPDDATCSGMSWFLHELTKNSEFLGRLRADSVR